MLENPYNLPESFEIPFEPYFLPTMYKNWLIINDIHVPYHNMNAINESINYGIKKSIDAIFINGDGMDCYMISKFTHDPLKPKVSQELIEMEDFIVKIQEATNAKIFYKFGNHEERMEYCLRRKAPEFLGIEEFKLENLLHLNLHNCDFIKDQRIVYLGELAIVHGHEMNLHLSIVNTARGLFLKTKRTCMCGHLHSTSNHNEMALDGKVISTWSTGCLCELHPEYKKINNWNHGCARIEVDNEGNFEVINLRLINNKLFRS